MEQSFKQMNSTIMLVLVDVSFLKIKQNHFQILMTMVVTKLIVLSSLLVLSSPSLLMVVVLLSSVTKKLCTVDVRKFLQPTP